ncbi:MAG: ZIP family metal transporter [Caldilineae bacterium]|nr:ZIP family metal transporter [Chloroflexota bacterium]MCB9177062.1 ZIP family metal transporter [Caldilineae bacterium]
MHAHASLTEVFVAALITAIFTGFGAIPFFFVKQMSRRWLGLANAIAAGLMLAASFSLIYQGFAESWLRTSLGVLAGLVFIALSRGLLSHAGDHEHPHAHGPAALALGTVSRAEATKMILIVGVMTLHSFAEGVGVGVAFGGGEAFGALITASIAFHNIPEGLAISLVLVPRGVSAWRAVLWSVFSSLPQPLMAVPAFLFVETFRPILPAGLGFAAGAMIWMCVAELLPEAYEDSGSSNAVAITVTLAVVLLMVFQGLMGM